MRRWARKQVMLRNKLMHTYAIYLDFFCFFAPFLFDLDFLSWLFMIAEALLSASILRSFRPLVLFNVFLIERKVDLGSFLMETLTSCCAGFLTASFFLYTKVTPGFFEPLTMTARVWIDPSNLGK